MNWKDALKQKGGENNDKKFFRIVTNILLPKIFWLLTFSRLLRQMGKNTQTQQKQEKILHECGFSKLKASHTKKSFTEK